MQIAPSTTELSPARNDPVSLTGPSVANSDFTEIFVATPFRSEEPQVGNFLTSSRGDSEESDVLERGTLESENTDFPEANYRDTVDPGQPAKDQGGAPGSTLNDPGPGTDELIELPPGLGLLAASPLTPASTLQAAPVPPQGTRISAIKPASTDLKAHQPLPSSAPASTSPMLTVTQVERSSEGPPAMVGPRAPEAKSAPLDISNRNAVISRPQTGSEASQTRDLGNLEDGSGRKNTSSPRAQSRAVELFFQRGNRSDAAKLAATTAIRATDQYGQNRIRQHHTQTLEPTGMYHGTEAQRLDRSLMRTEERPFNPNEAAKASTPTAAVSDFRAALDKRPAQPSPEIAEKRAVSSQTYANEFRFAGPEGETASVTSASPSGPSSPSTPANNTPTPVSVAQQLASAVVTQKDNRVELSLNPAELGRVRMSLQSQDGSLTLVIHVDRPETADLMRRHADTLATEFRQMGYSDLTLDISAGGERSPGQDKDTSRQVSGMGIDTDPADPATPSTTATGRSGGVDLKI